MADNNKRERAQRQEQDSGKEQKTGNKQGGNNNGGDKSVMEKDTKRDSGTEDRKIGERG